MERLKREIYDLSSIVDGMGVRQRGTIRRLLPMVNFGLYLGLPPEITHFFRHTFNEMEIDLLISKRKLYKHDLSKTFAIEALLKRPFIFFFFSILRTASTYIHIVMIKLKKLFIIMC